MGYTYFPFAAESKEEVILTRFGRRGGNNMWRLNRKGFTLVEIMIVVAIIGLLAAIAIPNFVEARKTAAKNACIANLRQLNSAVQMFAIDNDGTYPAAIADLAPYVRDIANVDCPGGGTYSLSVAGDEITCDQVGHAL